MVGVREFGEHENRQKITQTDGSRSVTAEDYDGLSEEDSDGSEE